jgi:predicted ATPase
MLAPALDDPAPRDWLDAEAFAEAARQACAGRDLAACRAALARFGGAYLPDDPYEEWAQPTRERLQTLHRALLLHMARLCAEHGHFDEAEVQLRTLLALDPCHEEGAARLMGLLAAQDRRSEALRVYETLAESLRAELDLAPGRDLRALQARLRASERAASATEVLPPKPPPARLSNLPGALTSFIGREREQQALLDLLGAATHGARLVTLTGIGGAGKTRLALVLGAHLLAQGAYQDGVWLVELAACADPELVLRSVARALGMREQEMPASPQALQAWLVEFLAPRHLLLLLDNCEHLVQGCAQLAQLLLHACPTLQILATSREALEVPGELIFRVPSLAVPPSSSMADDPDALLAVEAVALFVARARARVGGFALSEKHASLVAGICRQLDGIPLAIELAAARVGSLPLETLAARLDDRFTLLTGGPRTALPRQQTLRAMLDWSYNLLGDAERLLLAHLAVFKGGWTLAAAEQVCGEPSVLPVGEVSDLLGQLVAKSLVTLDESSTPARYTFLETIRHYAYERLLACGQHAALHRRHAAWCLVLAAEAEAGLRGPDQARWLQALETEHNNIRAALAWLMERPEDALLGMRLAALLWRFWSAYGHIHEGRSWLERMLAATATAAPCADGLAEDLRGWQEARALALNGAGNLAEYAGDTARSRTLHEEALALRRRLGDPMAIAGSLGNLGNVVHMTGDLQAAIGYYAEALPLFRQVENRWALAACLGNLGPLLMEAGETARARAALEESLSLRRQLQDTWGIAVTLKSLGNLALQGGELERAASLHTEALDLRRRLDDSRAIAESLTQLALVCLAQGDPARAWGLVQEALRRSRALGDRVGLAFELCALAETLAALDQPEGTLHVLAAAEALADSLRVALTASLPRTWARVQAWRDERARTPSYAAAWSAGARRDLDDLLVWIDGSPSPSGVG